MATSSGHDIALWQQVKQDDRAAYEVLYHRHMRALYAAICKWTENKADAEDILQEVFLDIWEKRREINIRHEIFPYLYTVTRYKVFDHLRHKKITAQQLKAWDVITEDPALNAAFRQESPEIPDALIYAEIEQLPAQMKQVYLLRFREGKSIREIADELLVSPYTIKNHLQKIRKRLHAAAFRLTSFLLCCLWMWTNR